jgi:hypothetical protein
LKAKLGVKKRRRKIIRTPQIYRRTLVNPIPCTFADLAGISELLLLLLSLIVILMTDWLKESIK